MGPDSLKIATLGEVRLHTGYNRIPFDLSFADDRVKLLQDALNKGKDSADMISIRRADNGKYFLPPGEYSVVVNTDNGVKKTSFSIE